MTRLALLRSLPLTIALACAAQADTVTLRPATGGGPEYRVEGTIVDYRGDAVVVQRERGRPKSYPADRVVGVETDWPEGYESAKRAIGEADWTRAAELLSAANRADQRAWVQRMALAELLRCRLALGQWKRAGDLLIALDASDPATPAWSLAPLPWFASDAVRPADARAWLARPEESARLLGAAWLLATTQRPAGRDMLQSLARSPRETIARLAETQLWRLDLTRVDASQADRWANRLPSMPAKLRAGPQHLLAQAYLRLKRYDEATLAALEAPLTGRAPHRLSARGLLLAGRALRASGQNKEAERLWREVVRDYADTPQRADAELLLGQ